MVTSGNSLQTLEIVLSSQMYNKEKFKAFLVESNEKKGVMDVDLDTLDEGDVLIKVSYSSFNYKDGLAITAQHHLHPDKYPF